MSNKSLNNNESPHLMEAQHISNCGNNYYSGRPIPVLNSKLLSLVVILGILLCSLFNPFLLINSFFVANDAFSEIETTEKFRALYVVASMAEYQTGAKGTVEGEDRFANTFVPIVSNAAHSIVNQYPTWDLDLFLIVGYKLRTERYDYLRKKLPEGVGLQLWEDAIPLSYNTTKDKTLMLNLQSVNRQHRFVLRDKLNHYDLFIVGEDDMAINSVHVEQYLDIQTEINRLKEEALLRENQKTPTTSDKFYGDLSSAQLSQMIAGFLRVEVLPADDHRQEQVAAANSMLNMEQNKMHVDPKPCCHLQPSRRTTDPFYRLPKDPKSDQLLMWETAIEALGVRKFPKSSHLDWVAYLPGVVGKDKTSHTADYYWSGRSGILGENPVRPSPHNLPLFAHQAMYIMTRDQLLALDKEQTCKGRFLPPFSDKYMQRNGIFMHHHGKWMNSAEFMVGGLQLYTNGAKNAENAGCNLQRIVSLTNFSKHLTYHISNNKQRTINITRLVLADDLLKQLNYVKDKAAIEMPLMQR
mmetsp:Transcript_25412/g.36410  ORF Transcript_25412/g.36410 Transcript_25412/m.36410 type:complete len:525 (+) Transcript_25412:84-1658(+)|eukprot:CAMPEP_0172419152 /NCGR_PEP_ID=MMETSP1064-20121228/5592_1 /TAXON_ID=202472 /ORGANISM="Aulacoseira subarctica , Strain CCAP 1002/5" /LENGTH=524 /DNA_ID=CAMNT_0013158471 /DNA_START=74 /DNA_END=1648 /DNA_ORIENTATION=-